jgi:cell wall-associated NlpC family hydrolase
MSRQSIIEIALLQVGKPYIKEPENSAGVKLSDEKPLGFDCSFFNEWCYLHGDHLWLPRSAANQFAFCKPTDNPLPGDLGFFADRDGHVYHAGLVVDNVKVVEARAPQEHTSFETGKVILRPLIIWANYNDPKTGNHFAGWRQHPNYITGGSPT